MPKRYYTIKDIRQIFRCSANTIYRRLREGKLPGKVKFGGKTLFLADEIDAYCDELADRNDDDPSDSNGFSCCHA